MKVLLKEVCSGSDNPHEVGLKFARSLLKSIQNRFPKFGLVDDLPAGL